MPSRFMRAVTALVLSVTAGTAVAQDSSGAAPVPEPATFTGSGASDFAADLIRRLEESERRLGDLESRNRQLTELLSQPDQLSDTPSFLEAALQQKSGEQKVEPPKEKKWYEKLNIRGYTQVRLNEEVYRDDNSFPANYVGDRSISDNQSFLIRRARVILFGDVHERVYLYFQPDFASTTPGSSDGTFFGQIRDLYADVYLDDEKEFRFRVGQSKVPYGWENLQSSQNRLPLDRADALNSAVRNERDLGVFFYWTPPWVQEMFDDIQKKGLKHSGNYGMFGFGAHNGQGGSFVEQNDGLHLVTRFTIPWQLENGQYVEAGVQAYQGEYAVFGSGIRPLGVGPGTAIPAGTINSAVSNTEGLMDERVAASFIWYPQPFGFQTEWTVGRGPGLNNLQNAVVERALYGGYAMFLYHMEGCWDDDLFPFVRWSYFKGGYKSERNAPYSEIDEWEMGVEWQIHKNAEFTLSYLITDRTNTNNATPAGVAPYGQYDGQVIRMQFQFNY